MNKKIAKLIYQSKHRGCKENDILLTRFTDKILNLSDAEIDIYEQFLNEDDINIYKWLCNLNLAPKKYKSIIKMIN